MWPRWVAAFCWAMLTWTLLTWTATVEQVLVGAVLSAGVATACAPLGSLAGPWRLLAPRRLLAMVALAFTVAGRVVVANARLTRLVWSRHVRPPSGMVIVPTTARSEGELAAVAVLTSVVVDSQIVDVDRQRHELQYHVVWAGPDSDANRRRINAPIEDRLAGITR